MLRKDCTEVQFTRPDSYMRRVLSAVEFGNCSVHSICDATGLDEKRVKSTLMNLTYTGAVKRSDGDDGSVYTADGQINGIASNLKGICSIFHAGR